MAISGWALLAHLVRPQGRHGEILADILTDFPERFSDRRRLYLLAPGAEAAPAPPQASPREIQLDDHWLHQGRIVLKFSGIDSIEDAETLRGFHVAIPENERAELTDGSVYISDLVGCTVSDLTPGEEIVIGTVTDFDRGASLLVLEDAKKRELLIPFASAYLETIDLPARRIAMRLPAGLLEINAPLTAEERGLQQQAAEEGSPAPAVSKKWTKHRPWKKKVSNKSQPSSGK